MRANALIRGVRTICSRGLRGVWLRLMWRSTRRSLAPSSSTLLDITRKDGLSADEVNIVAPRVTAGDTVEEVNEACTRRLLEIKTKQALAEDSTAKAKLVTGLLTGGIGALGGGATAGVAQSNSNAAMTLGIVTGVLSLVGGLTTALIAPGDNEISNQNALMAAIDQGVAKYNGTCATDPTIAQCSALLGSVRALCVGVGSP